MAGMLQQDVYKHGKITLQRCMQQCKYLSVHLNGSMSTLLSSNNHEARYTDKASSKAVVVNLAVWTAKGLQIIYMALLEPFKCGINWQRNVRLLTDGFFSPPQNTCFLVRPHESEFLFTGPTVMPALILSLSLFLFFQTEKGRKPSHSGTTALSYPFNLSSPYKEKYLFSHGKTWSLMWTERGVHSPVTGFSFSPAVTLEGF